jgi:hypothetical protein
MDRSVKETATDPRDSLSKYFAFHILPSNSPEIIISLTKAISPGQIILYKKKLKVSPIDCKFIRLILYKFNERKVFLKCR